MKLKIIDPEYPADISIATPEGAVEFTAVFRRVGRKEQKRLLDVINAWSDPADQQDDPVTQQENFITDLLIRFEGLPVDDEGSDQDSDDTQAEAADASIRTFIYGILFRRERELDVVEDDLAEAMLSRVTQQVDAVINDPDQLRVYQELEAVLDDPLCFTKVLNAAVKAVINAGVERSKN